MACAPESANANATSPYFAQGIFMVSLAWLGELFSAALGCRFLR